MFSLQLTPNGQGTYIFLIFNVYCTSQINTLNEKAIANFYLQKQTVSMPLLHSLEMMLFVASLLEVAPDPRFRFKLGLI